MVYVVWSSNITWPHERTKYSHAAAKFQYKLVYANCQMEKEKKKKEAQQLNEKKITII